MWMSQVKPMLASPADLTKLSYPVLVSPKLDGIRCLISDGVALSRSLKPIPNQYVQDWVKRRSDELEGLDGELIVGSPTAPDVYNVTQSGIMSAEGRPHFLFYVFDVWDTPTVPYNERRRYESEVEDNQLGRLVFLYQYRCLNEQEVLFYEQWFTEQGYEGVMIRDPNGLYKYGRSTVKEGYLLKLKRFEDSEAEIIGLEELMHNGNTLEQDNLGHAKRSSHKAGLHRGGTLGALRVRDIHTGVEFAIGTGFSASQREDYWAQGDKLLGQIARYKYLSVGVKKAPRHPVFLGFRDKRDM